MAEENYPLSGGEAHVQMKVPKLPGYVLALLVNAHMRGCCPLRSGYDSSAYRYEAELPPPWIKIFSFLILPQRKNLGRIPRHEIWRGAASICVMEQCS